MHKTVRHSLISRLFSAVALLGLLLAGFGTGDLVQVSAQQLAGPNTAPNANQPAIQPSAADASFYYYADGRRVPLTPSLDWVSVKFASDNPSDQANALAASGAPVSGLENARHIPNPQLTLLPLKAGVTVGDLVQGLNSMRATRDSFLAANPVFQTSDAEMAITDEFIATFPAGKSLKEIDEINAAHSVEIQEEVLGQPNTFVLRALPGSRLDALAMANLYQESGAASQAAPDFVRILPQGPEQSTVAKAPELGMLATPNDYWYFDQWALNNVQQYGTGMKYDADIDAPEAWTRTTGRSSVIIAVIDEGVELTQEDLSTKLAVVGGHDSTGGGSGGGPCSAPCGNEDDAHGTNVAGLAAASTNNTIGIAGVCPNCSIMPVRIAYGSGGYWITYDSWIADGIAWAYLNGASILNNSWGGGLPSSVISTAISNAKIYGRGGKGSVVVFAAGNNNVGTVSYPGSLSTVIAVGASNMCDRRKTKTNDACNGYEYWWGSNYGSALDISAPGVWLDSTDRMGSAGYDPSNYFRFMNGTSGATPIVSGVAGLVLSANPSLSADQVQNILQASADDVNGGGRDASMGWGRVNANNAVLLASSSTSQSVGVYDGWILESAESSEVGGTGNISGTAFNLGDNALRKQYRAILSFNTSVPSGAVITSVTLKIKKAGLSGKNPYLTMGNIVGDIKNGSFSDNPALELGDFQATSNGDAALTIPYAPVSGWFSGSLDPSAFGSINPSGVTQFRLRFQVDDNNNSVSDFLKFYSGNAKAANRPVLVIQFNLP